MKTLGAILGIVLAVASTHVVFAADLNGALAQVAAKIDQVPAVKGKKVGVGDFPLAGGRVSELSSYFADQLDVALTGRASSGSFEVVTRGQLCQVIRENKLWVDDRFDPLLNKKLGRLGQADVMLTGQVTPLAREVSLSLRLLDTETGKALWADSLKVPLDEGLRALMARAVTGDGCGAVTPTPSTTPPTPGADALVVKVSTDKSVYRIDEPVVFKVRVSRDAYVTLVDIGTSGDVTIIYPNRLHASHFVRGGEDVLVPPPDAGFTLTARGPAGFDQVRAIATEEPVKLHASDFGGQKAIFRSLDRVQTRDLAVTISTEREKVAPGKWAEHTIAVEVRR